MTDDEINDYIIKHYKVDMKVQEIADVVGLHRSSVLYRYRKLTRHNKSYGVKIKKYIETKENTEIYIEEQRHVNKITLPKVSIERLKL